jgi:hypothetical protein
MTLESESHQSACFRRIERFKKALLILVSCVVVGRFEGHCQGTIAFSNLAGPGGSSVDAPVTNAAGERIIGAAPYVADLFWSGETNTSIDSLSGSGFNQSFSTTTLYGGGYFFGGSKTLPTTGWILAQVRVWDATYGAAYAQARDNGGEYGFSNPILVLLRIPLNPPAEMTGLRGFQLERIPEPSSLAFAVIGGSLLPFYFRSCVRCKVR